MGPLLPLRGAGGPREGSRPQPEAAGGTSGEVRGGHAQRHGGHLCGGGGAGHPPTDLIVFYEPIPSEIRTIQRRGRTGRTRPGRVVVLVTRDRSGYVQDGPSQAIILDGLRGGVNPAEVV